MKKAFFAVILAVFLGIPPGFLSAQDQELPRFAQEVVVRYWLVPVYATKRDGSPAVGLKTEDLELYVNGRKVERFDLHTKEFQVVPVSRPESPAGQAVAPAPFQKKMVFLVFDSAFSNYNLLQKAKKVAETMMAQEELAAEIVAMSIEPFAGLKSICGPTRDRRSVARALKSLVSGKKAEYLVSSAMDASSIHDAYPRDKRYEGWNPPEVADPKKHVPGYERYDSFEKKRIAVAYTQALMTLNLILGYFKDHTKVVYLFSCGIPSAAMEIKTEYDFNPNVKMLADQNSGDLSFFNLSPDSFNIKALQKIGQSINKNGSLLFLINPSGTRVSFTDQDSGEQSLRLLAEESGGRYYEGTEKDIAKEIAGMESAYYEISFPDDKAYEGLDIDFEIRAKDPGLNVYSVKRISRGKDYAQMAGLERQVLILNFLDNGPFAQTKLKVTETRAKSSIESGHVFFDLNLPPELAGAPWDIFKVWRSEEDGRIIMEEDRLLNSSHEVRQAMAFRKGFSHEIALVHGKSGTAIKAKR